MAEPPKVFTNHEVYNNPNSSKLYNGNRYEVDDVDRKVNPGANNGHTSLGYIHPEHIKDLYRK